MRSGEKAAPPPSVEYDPTVAAASPSGWRRWLGYLLTRAKARLAEVSLALLGALLLEGVALAFFGNLADEVAEGETQALDESSFHFLRGFASPGLDALARLVSAMGSEVVAALLLILTLYFVVHRRWGTAVSLVVVTGGAQLLNNVLKDHFRRTRPLAVTSFIGAQVWSFPSGHAMVSAAFYLFLAYVGWRLLPGAARWAWSGALMLLVLLIGLSRMYLGVHYLTDVVAGYAAGTAWMVAVVLAGRALAVRRPVAREPASPTRSGTA
jgi:undecaprenyl-diphosphatase